MPAACSGCPHLQLWVLTWRYSVMYVTQNVRWRTLGHVSPARQISKISKSVWLGYSLLACRCLGLLAIHRTLCDDLDYTARMRRLVCLHWESTSEGTLFHDMAHTYMYCEYLWSITQVIQISFVCDRHYQYKRSFLTQVRFAVSYHKISRTSRPLFCKFSRICLPFQ